MSPPKSQEKWNNDELIQLTMVGVPYCYGMPKLPNGQLNSCATRDVLLCVGLEADKTLLLPFSLFIKCVNAK